ncbi:MAG: hypothetical protein ACSLEM_00925 [Candidatus Malihini olakiniferum]
MIIRRTILCFYIETFKQILDAINKLRVERALESIKPDFQQANCFLTVLLYHYHPLMPGYLEGKVSALYCGPLIPGENQ